MTHCARLLLAGLFAGVLALPARAQDAAALVRAARAQVGVTVAYDPAYVRLPYPNGDVPRDRGVCADVVVRAFRGVGLDLQKLVHEDMRAHFGAYPKAWGLRRPDPNIDHRRVLNLETFFGRRGLRRRDSFVPADYAPGDIVSWRLPGNLPHIGVISDRTAADGSGRPLVIHNVGAGAREEDVLYAWPQSGHYRWVWPRVGDQPGAARARPHDRPRMAGPGDHRSARRAMDGNESNGSAP